MMGYSGMIWFQLFAESETSEGFTRQNLVVSKCVGDPFPIRPPDIVDELLWMGRAKYHGL
jgi:hypothetical protein